MFRQAMLISKWLVHLWPFFWLFLAVLVFSVYVFITSPGRYKLKLVLIPTAFIFPIIVCVMAVFFMGYSVPSKLPDQFTFAGFQVVLDNRYQKVGIEVWVTGRVDRLLLVPYDAALEKALKEAQKKQTAGGMVVMERFEEREEGTDSSKDKFRSKLLMPHELDPKAPSSPAK
jgi:hypothetical protein